MAASKSDSNDPKETSSVFKDASGDPIEKKSSKRSTSKASKGSEVPVDKPIDAPADKPVDSPIGLPADLPVDPPVDKPSDPPLDSKSDWSDPPKADWDWEDGFVDHPDANYGDPDLRNVDNLSDPDSYAQRYRPTEPRVDENAAKIASSIFGATDFAKAGAVYRGQQLVGGQLIDMSIRPQKDGRVDVTVERNQYDRPAMRNFRKRPGLRT